MKLYLFSHLYGHVESLHTKHIQFFPSNHGHLMSVTLIAHTHIYIDNQTHVHIMFGLF